MTQTQTTDTTVANATTEQTHPTVAESAAKKSAAKQAANAKKAAEEKKVAGKRSMGVGTVPNHPTKYNSLQLNERNQARLEMFRKQLGDIVTFADLKGLNCKKFGLHSSPTYITKNAAFEVHTGSGRLFSLVAQKGKLATAAALKAYQEKLTKESERTEKAATAKKATKTAKTEKPAAKGAAPATEAPTAEATV